MRVARPREGSVWQCGEWTCISAVDLCYVLFSRSIIRDCLIIRQSQSPLTLTTRSPLRRVDGVALSKGVARAAPGAAHCALRTGPQRAQTASSQHPPRLKSEAHPRAQLSRHASRAAAGAAAASAFPDRLCLRYAATPTCSSSAAESCLTISAFSDARFFLR